LYATPRLFSLRRRGGEENGVGPFPSAVEAVQAAVEVQKSVEAHNIELEAERRMKFRIGVNLGRRSGERAPSQVA
jgi:hypothetical protein